LGIFKKTLPPPPDLDEEMSYAGVLEHEAFGNLIGNPEIMTGTIDLMRGAAATEMPQMFPSGSW
jgi:hypothetical protein